MSALIVLCIFLLRYMHHFLTSSLSDIWRSKQCKRDEINRTLGTNEGNNCSYVSSDRPVSLKTAFSKIFEEVMRKLIS
jgi:hypothetical protein